MHPPPKPKLKTRVVEGGERHVPSEQGSHGHRDTIWDEVSAGFARTREHDRLEPGGQVVHDGEVAHGDHEACHAYEHWNFHVDEGWWEDGLRSEVQFDDDEDHEEHVCQDERHIDGRGGPLCGVCQRVGVDSACDQYVPAVHC